MHVGLSVAETFLIEKMILRNVKRGHVYNVPGMDCLLVGRYYLVGIDVPVQY